MTAHGHVAAFVNALGGHDFHQQLHQHVPNAFDAHGENLHAQIIAEFIHYQPGEEIGFGIDQPAGAGVAQGPPVIPGVLNALFEKFPVAHFVLGGEHAQGDDGIGVIEAPADVSAPEIMHLGDVAGGEVAFYLFDFGIVYPGMSRAHAGLSGFAQCNNRHVPPP